MDPQQDPKILRAKIKDLESEVDSLKHTIKTQKFSHLSMSASLSKLLNHLEDPNFDNKDWLRFMLTGVYYSYLFQREDEEYQKGAVYIKSMIDLYP